MIEIRVDGRLALTTEQAVAASDRWPSTGALRAWIARNHVQPAERLNARTPLWYPEDLGIEEQS